MELPPPEFNLGNTVYVVSDPIGGSITIDKGIITRIDYSQKPAILFTNIQSQFVYTYTATLIKPTNVKLSSDEVKFFSSEEDAHKRFRELMEERIAAHHQMIDELKKRLTEEL